MSNLIKAPNPEQLIAINHLGGKILSAGAGSGKTFVLIEHIVIWLNNLRVETSPHDWQQKIPLQMSKIALMTFTKKAAGEMSIRMMKRVDELCLNLEDESEKKFWNLVRQYLPMMNIMTISSFCHQLISQGYFSNIGSDVQILSNVEFKNKISNLFNLWFISRADKLNQVFEANSTALIDAMIEIFKSAELRLMWKEALCKSSAFDELSDYIERLISKLDLTELFNGSLDLNAEFKEREKGWFVFLQGFENLVSKEGPLSPENFKSYAVWSENIGTLPREVKAMTEIQRDHLNKVKSLVKEIKDVREDFINFIDYYDVYWLWVETFKDVYNFIDQNYFIEKGFTFADLEYFVCTGLRNANIREKIMKNYSYFIVDEFQDTSSVQFEIIRHLVGDNFQRLFCVGDKKQAIYGFRGGELLVFSQCAEMLGVENNIWLKNNFRSEGRVINFNNQFFNMVFPLGIGFEGFDARSVLMEAQTIPEKKLENGIVEKIKTEVTGLASEKRVNLDFYEAEALFEIIVELLARDDIQNICVLYRRLKPSSYLLKLFAKNEVPFSAQVKVEYGEDPIINLFLRVIELKLNQADSAKLASTHFLIDSLLEVLQLEAKTRDIEEIFLGDLEVLGLRLAFHKLAYSLGISNSQYNDNSKLIDSICVVCNEDLVKVFYLLSSESSEQYSLELMKGSGKKRVTIMSAHASKGLEFDAVLLGGIHSNGSQIGKTETIGRLPKSFRWKKAYNQKKFFKSPTYYLEDEIDKAKDFSESKRLLYVACTRAVKYLGWIDLWARIEGDEKMLASGSNHWIKAFRLNSLNSLFNERSLQIESISERQEIEIPLILKDSLGIVPLVKNGHLGVFAETSVTKLAQLVQCPFKFYLSNVCKISPPGANSFVLDEENEEFVDEEDIFYSSKDRGIKVHENLSQLILGKITLNDIEINEREKIEWTLKEAKEVSRNKNVISEKQIKFTFFGQMISGTPDLVFEDSENIIIWDFKTGYQDEEKEGCYWFQLMCYGYAYANLKRFTPEKMIPLTLIYIDQKKLVTKNLTLSQISQFLFDNWTKTESLNQVNLSHCRHCEYSLICHHHKSSAP